MAVVSVIDAAWSFLIDLLKGLLGSLNAAYLSAGETPISLLSIFAGFCVLGIILNLLYRKG